MHSMTYPFHVRPRFVFTVLLVVSLSCSICNAFAIPPKQVNAPWRVSLPSRWYTDLNFRLDDLQSTLESTTVTQALEGEWRQYISLAVVVGVLVDIVLGSPLANAALKPLRGAQEQLHENFGSEKVVGLGSKERIDTDKVAQEAIDKARNVLELRNYLESRKSDWDRLEELKRDVDNTMQSLDEDLRAKQQNVDKQAK